MLRNNPTAEYYNLIEDKLVIGVDFDNTVVLDEWPYVGPTLDGAAEVLNEIQRNGHKIVLFTQRMQSYPKCCPELAVYADEYGYNDDGTLDLLTPAYKWFRDNLKETIYDINENSLWEDLTGDKGRKIYMDILIDDHNVGMKYKMIRNRFGEDCQTVDWKFVDEWLVNRGVYLSKVL